MNCRLETFRDWAELAARTRVFLEQGTVALSGGTTATLLYPHWVAMGPRCEDTVFFPVDERMVPFDDPRSNWGTAYREFLSKIGRDADKSHHPLSTAHYTAILDAYFPGTIPRFDTILLGAGDDGHTASLFPGSPLRYEGSTPVLQTRSPKPPHDRLTLAPPVLITARNLVLIIAGAGKEGILQRLIAGDTLLPVTDILSRHPSPVVFVEERLFQTTNGSITPPT